jgi:hypothetical protein
MADQVDIKVHLTQAAENIVNGARRGSYGKPESNFGRIALLWQAWFKAKDWVILPRACVEVLEEGTLLSTEIHLHASHISPMMRLMKEARLCETPDHYDSHLDLVGYTLTGAEVNGVTAPMDTTTALSEAVIRAQKAESALWEALQKISKLEARSPIPATGDDQ